MTEEAKKAVLMVHLDPELKKELALQAVQEGRSMSAIVRRAIGTYIRVHRLLHDTAPGHDPMTPTADELEREA